MSEKESKYIYFKSLGKKQVQVSKEQWENDWKIWYNRISKSSEKRVERKNTK